MSSASRRDSQQDKERQKLAQLETAFVNGKSKIKLLNLGNSVFNFYAQCELVVQCLC